MPPNTRRPARAKPKPDEVPAEWAGRELVVLRGGPYDGWWYFAEDIAVRAAARERFGQPWPYAATSEKEPHPDHPVASGTVHRYRELS